MDTLQAIETRRSIKKYDPEHRLGDDETRKLLALAMLSPSAYNIQHWRFVVVGDPELRRRIREASWNQAQVTDASLLIIVCADLKAWEKQPERYFADASENVVKHVLAGIETSYRGQLQAQRDEALRSCGIAAQTLMIAARGMGYDSCPMVGFNPQAVAKLINLPEDHLITMFVVVGKSIEGDKPRRGRLTMDEVVIHDRFA